MGTQLANLSVYLIEPMSRDHPLQVHLLEGEFRCSEHRTMLGKPTTARQMSRLLEKLVSHRPDRTQLSVTGQRMNILIPREHLWSEYSSLASLHTGSGILNLAQPEIFQGYQSIAIPRPDAMFRINGHSTTFEDSYAEEQRKSEGETRTGLFFVGVGALAGILACKFLS